MKYIQTSYFSQVSIVRTPRGCCYHILTKKQSIDNNLEITLYVQIIILNDPFLLDILFYWVQKDPVSATETTK